MHLFSHQPARHVPMPCGTPALREIKCNSAPNSLISRRSTHCTLPTLETHVRFWYLRLKGTLDLLVLAAELIVQKHIVAPSPRCSSTGASISRYPQALRSAECTLAGTNAVVAEPEAANVDVAILPRANAPPLPPPRSQPLSPLCRYFGFREGGGLK
eukprot:3037864-Rhodomonas_salina.3